MKRTRFLIGLTVLIAAVTVVSALTATPRRTAERTIRAYDLALSSAVRQLDPELLDGAASAEEKQRVANYVTLLWGQKTALEATLESLEVGQVEESTESTIIVTVVEEWTYQDVASDTGEPAGEVRFETMSLRYTLIREDGGWVVGRSSITEDADQDGSL